MAADSGIMHSSRVTLKYHSASLKQPLWPELEVSAKKMLRNFSLSWPELFKKIIWMLVGYLIWMKLPFPLSKTMKVLDRKGKHQVGAMTSAERGTTTTWCSRDVCSTVARI